MTDNSWFEILGRTSPKQPVQLDALITDNHKPKAFGKVVFPEMDLTPSMALWEHDKAGPTYIGIRVLKPLESAYNVARLLAAAALEREVFPVILSRVEYSGFEQFGFRVERIPDEPAAALVAEAEIKKFWDLAIIIDGDEIGFWSGQNNEA